MTRRALTIALLALAVVPGRAAAQLDPLIYLKKNTPNVLIAVDTANRMQRDVYNDYIDDNVYRRLGTADASIWEAALGLTDANTAPGGTYRRKYVSLAHRSGGSSEDRFETTRIDIVGDQQAGYATFDSRTRMSIARQALVEAINANTQVARFGLLRTRQSAPRFDLPVDSPGTKWRLSQEPTRVRIIGADAMATLQKNTGDSGNSNRWKITRPLVNDRNTAIAGPVAPLVAPDASGANSAVLSILRLPTGAANSLLPAGQDEFTHVDTPVDAMLEDLRREAERLIAADPDCANTVAVLVAGGGEGTTARDPVSRARTFLNISGRRVPIYVVAIAPQTAAERTQLQSIARESGGQYTEITPPMFEAAGQGNVIPELVRAVNVAVSHGFANQTDFNRPPDIDRPFGYLTEHQVTSPIIGTVNLENARDITGSPLTNTIISHPVTKQKIPQRSNVLITSGFSLPGFDGKLRAFRVYRPVADASKPIGYKFTTDGLWERRLWVASTPEAASRNIYTALPNGSVVAFAAANAAVLMPYLKAGSVAEATALINFIRSQPLGAIVGSTPAIMDPPSLDPPPDADYPRFIDDNKDRRSIIWVGANDGMLHGIDARLGKEVWAFIPFNLLPKLSVLRSGQPTGDFRFFVDGSPKVADVKVNGSWRTYLVMGEGAGGTFYQTFDVTLDNMARTVTGTSDDLAGVLAYFASPTAVRLRWTFPSYSHFDVNIGAWGDIAASAPAISKTVGETWSDPAVGQVENASGRFVVLTGSGFFRYSLQQQANRGGIVAGTTFYMLDIRDGAVLDSENVGSDNQGEETDNCASAAVNDCRRLKNALQADPVATGPPDSRFVTKTYLGDLDGRIWRFDITLDSSGVPQIGNKLLLYTVATGEGAAADHPIFASMATVNVGATQQYLFVGTGSDLLPQNRVQTQYALLVVLDNGPSGSRTAMLPLERTDGALGDEKVSAFPAVAGDIVFFTTTTYRAGGCSLPDANLYAFTFIGGPAYDTNNDGRVTTSAKSGPADSQRVQTVAGARATAPFIVDQHLVTGVGPSIEMFGDPEDFNNGVGQAGVRILSWREVR